ncbi:hypothetical protein ACFLUS_00325 [Chloroflexota bacterium]
MLASSLAWGGAGRVKAAILYLVAISVAEIVTNYYDIIGGIIFHIVLLIALVVHSTSIKASPTQKLILSLAMAPLIRVVSLTIPLTQVALFLGAWVAMRHLDYTPGEIGFHLRGLPLQLVIALSGFLFGLTEYFISRPELLIPEFTWQQLLVGAFILTLGTGLVEEFIFRGII